VCYEKSYYVVMATMLYAMTGKWHSPTLHAVCQRKVR